MRTSAGIHGVKVQPLLCEESAHASGHQIGRYHGIAVITDIFADHDRSQAMHTLSQSSRDIERYFAEIARSYAVPYIRALFDAFGDAAGDRIAAYAVHLLLDIDPAELAREIAAVRRGIMAGFATAIKELGDESDGDAQAPVDPTFVPPKPTEPSEDA